MTAPINPATEQEFTVDHFAFFTSAHAGFFVGWGTLTLINAGLAQGKNRSGLAWWAISLFLGPLATLILVVLPKVRAKMF
jgi:hypothetical protein